MKELQNESINIKMKLLGLYTFHWQRESFNLGDLPKDTKSKIENWRGPLASNCGSIGSLWPLMFNMFLTQTEALVCFKEQTYLEQWKTLVLTSVNNLLRPFVWIYSFIQGVSYTRSDRSGCVPGISVGVSLCPTHLLCTTVSYFYRGTFLEHACVSTGFNPDSRGLAVYA